MDLLQESRLLADHSSRSRYSLVRCGQLGHTCSRPCQQSSMDRHLVQCNRGRCGPWNLSIRISNSKAGGPYELAAGIAFHCLGLTVTGIVIGTTTLIASRCSWPCISSTESTSKSASWWSCGSGTRRWTITLNIRSALSHRKLICY